MITEKCSIPYAVRTLQRTDVVDVQPVLVQGVIEIAAVGERSSIASCMPLAVRIEPPVVGPLAPIAPDSTGASKVRMSTSVPTWLAIVIADSGRPKRMEP